MLPLRLMQHPNNHQTRNRKRTTSPTERPPASELGPPLNQLTLRPLYLEVSPRLRYSSMTSRRSGHFQDQEVLGGPHTLPRLFFLVRRLPATPSIAKQADLRPLDGPRVGYAFRDNLPRRPVPRQREASNEHKDHLGHAPRGLVVVSLNFETHTRHLNAMCLWGSYRSSLTLPASTTNPTSGIVMDVSATFVATTTLHVPGGGISKTRL